jgi:hypothetical protein
VPPTDEWIKKIWSTSTMKYYSTIKKKGVMLFAKKWMELEIILLSKEGKYHIFSNMWNLDFFLRHEFRKRTVWEEKETRENS